MSPGPADVESSGIRLQLLIYIRWIAIVGQAVALAIVGRYVDVDFAVAPAFALVGASALLNILLLLIIVVTHACPIPVQPSACYLMVCNWPDFCT